MLFLKARSGAKNAAEIADVFAHDDHIGIFGKLDVERFVDRLDHVQAALGSTTAHGLFFRIGAHEFGLPSGNFVSRSRMACSLCSFRCQGSSSNTSSNMVLNG